MAADSYAHGSYRVSLITTQFIRPRVLPRLASPDWELRSVYCRTSGAVGSELATTDNEEIEIKWTVEVSDRELGDGVGPQRPDACLVPQRLARLRT